MNQGTSDDDLRRLTGNFFNHIIWCINDVYFRFMSNKQWPFCERRYNVQHYQPVIHLKKEKKEMKKVFGTEDSFLYADNNTSWANDLALELWYNFNYIQLHMYSVIA